MRTIELAAISIGQDRQRKEDKDSKSIASLKKSILSKGLLHPPVLTQASLLVAGERRLIACTELHADGLPFLFDGEPVPLNTIPYTLVSELSADDLEEAELEENVLRVALSWQEEGEAKLRIHEMRQKKNPGQTKTATAKEIASVNGQTVAGEASKLSRMAAVLPHLGAPSVKGAKSLDKAYDIVMRGEEARLLRDLSKLQPIPTNHQVLLGDCRELMKTLTPASFDLILSDPPYGIGADKMKSDVGHHYDDSKDNALALYREIFRQGFRLLKPQGLLFLFCDVEHFITLRTYAEQMAFSTFRTPVIWHKGEGGNAPWGRKGFTRTYEILLFAAKGQKALVLGGGSDVRTVKRNTKDVKIHGAEKPAELFRWLLEISCIKGDKVLDPCCGSGPVISAARGLDLSVTAIEINPEYHAVASARLQETDEAPESIVARPQTVDDIEESIFGATQ